MRTRIQLSNYLFGLSLVYVIGGMLILVAAVAHAQVRASANYRLEADSVNVGGIRSSSASYTLEDTTGEQATGRSTGASYVLDAGYQEMLVNYISMTAPADVSMSPTLGGLTGGTANGSTAVTVITDSAAGYQLSIKASTSPAMQSPSSDTIADYTPSGGVPDFAFSVPTGVGEFGFSPEGTDIAQRYQDNGATCNTGSSDTSLSCWDALTTSDRIISERVSGNHPSGTLTTIRFRTGIGANSVIVDGTYTATTTLTALAL